MYIYAIQLSSADFVRGFLFAVGTADDTLSQNIKLLHSAYHTTAESKYSLAYIAHSRLCIVEKFDCSVPHDCRLKILFSPYQRNYAIAI